MPRLTIRRLMLFVLVVAIYAGGMRAILQSRPSNPVAVLIAFVLGVSLPILVTARQHWKPRR